MKVFSQNLVAAQSGHLTLERARQAARTAKSSRPGGSDLIVSSPRGQSLYRSFLGLITVSAPQTQPIASGTKRHSTAKKVVVKKKAAAKKKVAAKKGVAVFKKVVMKKNVARKK